MKVLISNFFLLAGIKAQGLTTEAGLIHSKSPFVQCFYIQGDKLTYNKID